MIDVRGVEHGYAGKPVLRGVDLQVAAGEFVALFGANGAGKTTLLRILATLARPVRGRVVLGGFDLAVDPQALRAVVGFVGHHPLLYPELTAIENLQFYASLYGVEPARVRCDALLEQVGLMRQRAERVRYFSRGMQQRLAIARAILHSPRVLLLDEPHSGLDQNAAAQLDALLQAEAAAGRSVLLVTHDVQRGIALADRVLVLGRGRVVYACAAASVSATELSGHFAGADVA